MCKGWQGRSTAAKMKGMNTQRIRTIYSVTLVILDALLIGIAFWLAYQLRVRLDWPEPLANQVPFIEYSGLLLLQIAAIGATMFFYRQYYIPRAASRVDQVYNIFTAVTLGVLISIALFTFIFKNDPISLDYPRAMVVYAWLLTIVLLVLGRVAHQLLRVWLLSTRNIGRDRLLMVGSDEMARIVLQRILWSPNLGYELVGIINENESAETEFMDVPILGVVEELPYIIEHYKIDEVLIATPEKGHRATVRILSYCEAERVTVKIFPDVFEYVTSEANIDDLGGLPLLSVRDYAQRGYMLIFKRLLDFFGAAFGLVFISPLMLFTAIAIKLESPGPVFFVQERMGLDGRPFKMIKFRSMRSDAEKDGPGWTTDDDPRQTRFGAFLRRFELDELPNLINVLLGEMSLVGPRPEQAHYVAQFRETIPHYMARHREKGGMTGWAQVNGLRGDTSITERTKYDMWYSTNWSILLDIKIIVRTIWQIVERTNSERKTAVSPPQSTSPAPERQEETPDKLPITSD